MIIIFISSISSKKKVMTIDVDCHPNFFAAFIHPVLRVYGENIDIKDPFLEWK